MSPKQIQFEQTLAWHCAPSLAGVKPADLVTLNPKTLHPGLLEQYIFMLAQRGIRLQQLGRYRERTLLLVYRPEPLTAWLRQAQVVEMLHQMGYPVDGGVPALLSHLQERLKSKEFPHEIGLFLGYPPADVEGFLQNGGQNSKLCGPWKVYGDVEQAQRLFSAFHRCRTTLFGQIKQGISLAQILSI
ncbi:MAG: DUF3793 family protein [Lawsonibacter sp.]|jgi:hypothetical protein